MNPTVKTGVAFVLGALCGAVLSRRQYMIDNPRFDAEGRPTRRPWVQRAYAKKYGSAPSPSSSSATESAAAAVTPAKE
ncbi:hypothetical protein FNV43_RR18295 [Rhamnella rubrinervis]|uniref:Uncharacterized protein n=1 Tax=Rhamnella rubrinervis TaxID=2594499 RepID=A0A8K0EAV9_9ROSA|nr:hypothetical protein FNV43_RR18295 [Rhamnella rubrinervis]